MPHELWIYDVIGEGFFSEGVTAKRIRDELQSAPSVERLLVRINSPGGDFFEAAAIVTLLSQWQGGVDVQIDGIAASAGSYIATAGENVAIADGAMVMIHNAWTVALGNANELTKTADTLGKIDGTLAAAYARKSGKDAAEIMAAMEAETWYTSDEAIAFGLADSKAELAALAYAIPQEFGYRNGPKPASIERPAANIAALKRKFDLTKARRSA